MVDRKREGKELKEVFQVLGSTGNVSPPSRDTPHCELTNFLQVYTVTIEKTPSCDCESRAIVVVRYP